MDVSFHYEDGRNVTPDVSEVAIVRDEDAESGFRIDFYTELGSGRAVRKHLDSRFKQVTIDDHD